MDPAELSRTFDELEMAYGEDDGRFWGLTFGSAKSNVDEHSKLILLVKETLEELDFGPSDLTDRGLQYVANLSKLRKLDLWHTQVTGRGLKVLLTLPHVEELTCTISEHTAEGLSYIGQATTLKRLSLRESAVTDADLAALSHLAQLEWLDLQKTSVCRGVSVVEQMPHLRYLNLSYTKVDDAALESVGRCAMLDELWMSEVKISDAGVRHLRNLEKLRVISFAGQVTAVGVQHLVNLRQLKSLCLLDVRLDHESVGVLCGMKQLEDISLRKENIAASDLSFLRKSLPKCELEVCWSTDS